LRKLIYIFFFLTFFQVLNGEERGIEVRPGQAELIEIDPGQIVTTTFRITNKSDAKLVLMPELKLTTGWKSILKNFAFELEPGQSEMKLISIYVPQNTIPGDYEVIYRVQGREFLSYESEAAVTIKVQQQKRLKLSILEKPEYCIAGDTCLIKLSVMNISNISDFISFESFCQNCDIVEILPKEINLDAGAEGEVNVRLKTRESQNFSSKLFVQLQAKFKNDNETLANVTCMIDVISRVEGSEGTYHRLPVVLALRGLAFNRNKAKTAIQGDVNIDGTIDEDGKHRVIFNLRGPDIYGLSVYSQRDRIHLGWEYNGLKLYAGDRAYRLSHLTERARYGRGAGLYFEKNNFQAGSFYFKSIWRRYPILERAAYIKYKLAGRYNIGLNYLHKEGGDGNGDIFSIQNDILIEQNVKLELEYAAAKKDGYMEGAYNVKLRGVHKKVDYLLNIMRADKCFPGYYRDTNFLSANLGVSIINNLKFRISLRRDQQNFAMDTTRYSSPLSKYFQFGFNYKMNDRINLSINRVELSREDRMPQAKFNYDENYTKFAFDYSLPDFSFQLSSELGHTNNVTENRQFNAKRLSATIYYRPRMNISFRGYLDYSANGRYSDHIEKRWIAGTTIDCQFKIGTSLSLSYQNYFSPEDYFKDRNLFEFRVKQNLFTNHILMFRIRQTLMRNSLFKKDIAAIVEYKLPLNLPVSRLKNASSVKGIVFNNQTGLPVKDMVITINGAKAVTDKNGKYCFPALKPGDYYLTVDQKEIGLKHTVMQKLPMRITIEGGEELVYNLNISRSAKLTGRVVLYGFAGDSSASAIYNLNTADSLKLGKNNKSGSKYRAIRGLKGIIVELERDEDKLRRVTDERGLFFLEDLRPGKWQLKIYSINLPEYHFIENSIHTIQISPGESEIKLIRVLPRKRKLKIIKNTGTLEIMKTIDNVPKIEINTNNVDIRTQYEAGIKLFDKRQFNKALDVFSELLLNYSQNQLKGHFIYWSGECYNALEKYDSAIKMFTTVIDKEVTDKIDDALMMRGIIRLKLKKLSQAADDFKRLLRLYPQSEYTSRARKYLLTL